MGSRYLDVTEQQFWLDLVEGVHYSLPFMTAAAIYRRSTNQEVAKIGNFFESNMKQPYRNWWRLAASGLSSYRWLWTKEGTAGLEELAKLVDQGHISFPISTLKEDAARSYYAIADKLYDEKSYSECIPFLTEQ